MIVPRGVWLGVAAMTVIVAASNVLVQHPINDWLTWGAFSDPVAFLGRLAHVIRDHGPLGALFAACYDANDVDIAPPLTRFVTAIRGTEEPRGTLIPDFKQHCQRCHKLTFDASFPDAEVPHGGDPGIVYGFVGGMYSGDRALAGIEGAPGGPIRGLASPFLPGRPLGGPGRDGGRRDVVVVASVSCIYGLGSPEEWRERVLILEVGEEHDRDAVLQKLIDSQYVRNDTVLGRGRFRVKGDVVEVQPARLRLLLADGDAGFKVRRLDIGERAPRNA